MPRGDRRANQVSLSPCWNRLVAVSSSHRASHAMFIEPVSPTPAAGLELSQALTPSVERSINLSMSSRCTQIRREHPSRTAGR